MIRDKEQVLLDLLAGWASFIYEQGEAHEDEGDAEHERVRRAYPDAYARVVMDLYSRASDDLGKGELDAAAFAERYLLPLLR